MYFLNKLSINQATNVFIMLGYHALNCFIFNFHVYILSVISVDINKITASIFNVSVHSLLLINLCHINRINYGCIFGQPLIVKPQVTAENSIHYMYKYNW